MRNYQHYIITPKLNNSIYTKLLNSKIHIDYLQLRDYNFSVDQFEDLCLFIKKFKKQFSTKILINQFLLEKLTINNSLIEIFDKLQIEGVHCSFKQKNYQHYPNRFKSFISCHNNEEIETASIMGFSAITISPLFKTSSHPNTPFLGIEKINKLANIAKCPVYVLGGVSVTDKILNFSPNIIGLAFISDFFY